MKKRICVGAAVAAMLLCVLSGCFSQQNADLPKEGQVIEGFEVVMVDKCKNESIDYVIFEHEKTGAEVLYLANDDTNRAFEIAFRTMSDNDMGTSHVLEHSVMSGSRNYPSSTLYMKVSNQTYNTYTNASTGRNFVTYPMSSLSEDQLYNLSDYYLDSVFYPNIYTDDSVIKREGWRYELHSADDELTVSGTVYSEQLGDESILDDTYHKIQEVMYPDSNMAYLAGGVPSEILKLTNEDMIEYHSKYYHPSNSLSILYGDLDYARFLGLLDSYFSEFEKKDINLDYKAYTPTENYIQKTYEYPLYSGDDTQLYVIYAVECKGGFEGDLNVLHDIVEAMNDQSSVFTSKRIKELPGVSTGCWLVIDTPEPVIMFYAENVTEEEKIKFKDIVDNALAEFAEVGYSNAKKQSDIIVAKRKRSEAEGISGENAGVTLANNIARVWSVTGELSFDNVIALADKDDFDNKAVKKVAKKYFETGRKAFVTNIPKSGLKEKQQADFKAQLAQIKAEMSEEEINSIVEATKVYDAGVDNTALDKQLLEKIRAVDAQSLPEEYKNYEITDEVIDGVRYINVKTDIADIGKGRIWLDVSDMSGEDIYWLTLYNSLMGALGTEKYGMYEVRNKIDRYFGCSTMIKTVETEDGFIPYMVLEYKGLSDDSNKIFHIAEQMLFESDFSGTASYGNFIETTMLSRKKDIDNSNASYIEDWVMSAADEKYAYYAETCGIGYYNFLEKVFGMIQENPEAVTANLERIKRRLHNKNGACVVYAGDEKSIKSNTKAAKKFFRDMPDEEKKSRDFSYLKKEYADTALVVSADMNANGVYAPFEMLGSEYSGKTDVISRYVQDKWLIPEVRDKNNAYGVYCYNGDYGLEILSYRDPEVQKTFDVYSEIADDIEGAKITQQEIDNYILAAYSEYIMPEGELEDAYDFALEYINGTTYEDHIKYLREIKSTTVEDVKSSAPLFEKLWTDGIKFTAGNAQTIKENAELYDVVLNPFNYE